MLKNSLEITFIIKHDINTNKNNYQKNKVNHIFCNKYHSLQINKLEKNKESEPKINIYIDLVGEIFQKIYDN